MPPDPVLYDALLARDAAYDGRVFVGVRSTGIFCRLTCPARKPKRENCQFYDTVAGCMEAGFRPCKRCKPVATAADGDPTIVALLNALDQDPARRWLEADVAGLGFDPSTVRRAFKRHFGLTFLDMARQRRLAMGFSALSQGARVIDAQLDAGFDSPSAFRAAFASRIGLAPSAFRKDAMLQTDWIDSPLGPLVAVSDSQTLHLLEFFDRKALPAEMRKLAALAKDDIGFGRLAPTTAAACALDRYFAGKSATFDVKLTLHGTPFTQTVWRALQTIPAGQTRSYGQLATLIGQPNAARAVARANGANQIAILIPCHRVIGADGGLTGYGGGLWRKQRLIEIEQTLRSLP